MPENCSGLWRSQDMVLLQLHMQREAAHDTILKLGHLGCVQFREMNVGVSAFQRMFTNDIRRCEDSERRLRYFDEQVRREQLRHKSARLAKVDHASAIETLDTLEPKLEGLESELRELNSKWEQLLAQKNSMQEHLEVLSQDPSFFRGDEEGDVVGGGVDQGRSEDQVEDGGGPRAGGLRYITGMIPDDKITLFERLVYRATRGNMFMRFNPAKETFINPATGETVEKAVFVVFFSAQRAHDRIQKLCESLQASIVPYTIGNPQEQENGVRLRDDMEVLQKTIDGTEDVRGQILRMVQQNIYEWKKTVLVEKAVFSVMNMLSFKGSTAVAECWAPQDDLPRVQTALSEAKESSGAQVDSFMDKLLTKEKPPTYYKTNKFTSTHQSIVDSYGVSRYKEVNPTCFSIMTFPFLFAVMYGDIGHGFMLTVLATVFILKEKAMLATELNEIIAIVFGGRYVLFFMGLLAIYMGFLYNDFFGMMISPWGRPFWFFPEDHAAAVANCDPGFVVWHGSNASITQGCKVAGGSPYAFGVDSDWAEAENKLEFMNGLKMKMAVILGVAQMIWGLVLQLLNHIYFKDFKHIWFCWIPEVLFLSCTFGYMDIMIIVKWLVDWPTRMLNGMTPPSLLETMTNFFLAPGSVEPKKYLYGSASTQNSLQTFLLLVAFFSVPFMLIPIPIIEWRHHKRAMRRKEDKQALAPDELVDEGVDDQDPDSATKVAGVEISAEAAGVA
eukprot:RCo035855